MIRWDWKVRDYYPYAVSADGKCSLYEEDMATIVNCANCGVLLPIGESYTSLEIHNAFGFGYAVGEKCYREEWRRRMDAEKEKHDG